MRYEMRRHKQRLLDAEAWDILRQTEYGVLSTISRDGWPYGVPLNHVVIGDKLYFHAAPEGHKLSNLSYSNRVCYTVVQTAEVVPEKLSTRYRSVIIFGIIHAVQDREEKLRILIDLGRRFAPEHEEVVQDEMRLLDRTTVLEMTVEQIAGKQSKVF